MSEIICSCGHSIKSHAMPNTFMCNHCDCQITNIELELRSKIETISLEYSQGSDAHYQAIKEVIRQRDALHKQLEIAVETLEKIKEGKTEVIDDASGIKIFFVPYERLASEALKKIDEIK